MSVQVMTQKIKSLLVIEFTGKLIRLQEVHQSKRVRVVRNGLLFLLVEQPLQEFS